MCGWPRTTIEVFGTSRVSLVSLLVLAAILTADGEEIGVGVGALYQVECAAEVAPYSLRGPPAPPIPPDSRASSCYRLTPAERQPSTTPPRAGLLAAHSPSATAGNLRTARGCRRRASLRPRSVPRRRDKRASPARSAVDRIVWSGSEFGVEFFDLLGLGVCLLDPVDHRGVREHGVAIARAIGVQGYVVGLETGADGRVYRVGGGRSRAE
jgi:hypothetical protein